MKKLVIASLTLATTLSLHANGINEGLSGIADQKSSALTSTYSDTVHDDQVPQSLKEVLDGYGLEEAIKNPATIYKLYCHSEGPDFYCFLGTKNFFNKTAGFKNRQDFSNEVSERIMSDLLENDDIRLSENHEGFSGEETLDLEIKKILGKYRIKLGEIHPLHR